MLEAYSLDITLAADTAIPFNNVALQKGCTAVLEAPATIALNKCGVYRVECHATPAASTTIQLYKDGVAQPQAQSTGLNPSFATDVQVDRNNNPSCCCSSPVRLQVVNTEATTGDAFITVSKLC